MSAGSAFALIVVTLALALVHATCVAYSPTDHRARPERGRGDMPDENILAGMTGEQADADIARREAKVERLEATLRTAKDNLKAARSERRHLEEPTRTPPALTAVDFDRALNASAGTAKGSGEAGI